MTDTFHARHFNSIQALRGITAIFVALEHVRFLSCGAFGVDIFFCISGFMAMFASHHTAKDFLKKRFIRIYPFYAMMTLGTFLLLILFPGMFHLTQATPAALVKSLLFIPFEISEGIIQPLVRVGWTINYEMIFYLLFAASMRISHKYRGLICSGFLSTLVLLAHILPPDNTPLIFYGDFIQLEFILGIIAYYIVRKIYNIWEISSKAEIHSYCRLSRSLVLLLLLLLAITKQQTPIAGIGRVLYWGVPAFVIILLTFVMDLRLQSPGWLVTLGNMSFSIYLMHYYPLIFIDRKLFSLESFSPMAVLVTILGLAVVIAVSYVAHLLIEMKFSSYLRKLIK